MGEKGFRISGFFVGSLGAGLRGCLIVDLRAESSNLTGFGL